MPQLLVLLNHYYSEVYVTKPDFSRPASSEKYLVCIGFKGLTTDDQIEEEARDILIDIMKAIEKNDFVIPKNTSSETSMSTRFLKKLLGYNLSSEDELASKINEINFDHVSRQCHHIQQGVHLIHTKSLNNHIIVNSLKQKQVNNAIQWCQKYKLEYREDIPLSRESFDMSYGEIVNVSGTMSFTLSGSGSGKNEGVSKAYRETYQYLQEYYPQITRQYIFDRLQGAGQLEGFGLDSSAEYQYKLNQIDPFYSIIQKNHYQF